jgi:hypothetical protein
MARVLPQGLIGLPEFNVLLAGTLDAPMLQNRTTRTIIGFHVVRVPGYGKTVMGRPSRNINLGPGQQILLQKGSAIDVIINAAGDIVSGPGAPPHQAVILTAVIFDDGEVVGPGAEQMIQEQNSLIRAERDVHQMLLEKGHAVWSEIERIAQQDPKTRSDLDPKTDTIAYALHQRMMAQELVRVRDAPLGGEDEAIKLAHTSESYPNLWRQQ